MHQQQTAFQNIVGNGEIAHYDQFLLFPHCFLLNQVFASPFVHIFHVISLFATEFEELKIGISGKGLKGSRKAWIGALAAVINLKYCRKWYLTPYNQSINH